MMRTFSDTMDDWWHNLTYEQQLQLFSEYRQLMPTGTRDKRPQLIDVDEVWLIKPLTPDDEDYELGLG